MKVKDDFAGRRALCPFCKAEVVVPSQERAGERSGYSVADDDPPSRVDRDDEPRRRPRRRDEEDDEPRRRARLRDHDEDIEVRKRKSGGGGTNGGVLSGILMMVGALVWFFLALAVGWIAFYPPILFIVGLVTFIKGLSGNSE